MKVKKIVDLSWPLTNNTSIYPGDPEPNITVATTIEKEGYNLSRIIMGTQTGSHVDAPYHFLNGANTIDRMDLRMFFGEAVVIKVTHKNKREEITLKDIKKYRDKIKENDIILFNTNWYKKVGTDEYFDHPYISIEVAEFLIEKGVKFICIDTINADATGGSEFPVHDLFAKSNCMIGENMAYFDKIDFENVIIASFPMNIVGCDGSPVRIVAMESE